MNFVIRRIITLFLTILLISLITFLSFQLLPGNPARLILGVDAEEGQIAALEKKMGLDQPFWQRFLSWFSNALQGDLGESLRFSKPVVELISGRLIVTLSLALISLLITVVVAVPLGILAARANGKWTDFGISIISQIGMAIPSFWMGIILILLFGLTLQWFIPGGYVPWHENFWGAFRSLFFPALAIAIPQIAVIVRYLRTTVLEQLKMEYVRTAYSKGLSEQTILRRHILKNALIPVITVMGMSVADVLAGSIIIEQVYALPGMGRLLISAISYRDFPLIQGMILYIALIVTFLNFFVDLMYSLLDPRIRLE